MNLLRGMRDIYSPEIDKYDFIIDTARKIFSKYSYTRISTPLLEEFDLFKRSAGDETDIVSKEMYDFFDKGNRHIALRPEGTAGVVRAYLNSNMHKINPVVNWYYYGSMYRYEAPQKGRYREFSQIGVESFGIRSAFQDAEIISMALEFLKTLGLKDLSLEINTLGNINSRKKYIEKLKEYLLDNFDKLSDNSKVRVYKNPLRVLDSKEDDEIVKNAPKLIKYLDEESLNFFEDLKKYLKMFNINYTVNENLVRGLDYYQDTVFEIKSSMLGAQSTVLGGGRYDKLLEDLTNTKIPAIGFAGGIDRIALLIDEKMIEKNEEKIFVVYFENTKHKLIEIVEKLRNLDLIVNFEYETKSFNSQMKKANKLGATKVVILGEEELADNMVSVKDFKTSEQKKVSIDNLKEVV